MNDDREALANFSGTARLFPLPNLVLFPHVVQPLHVFEPRYRALTAEALAGDRLLALALLMPGWEQDTGGRPAIHPVACLGRVVAEQALPDGRYYLLVRGLSRARVRAEVVDARPFRSARVDLLDDCSAPELAEARDYRQRLAGQVLPRFAASAESRRQLTDLFQGELPLGSLCDILAFALPLPLELKQELLEQPDVTQRVHLLLDSLPAPPAADRTFPPDFSEN
jgi:Lon protease-like protein